MHANRNDFLAIVGAIYLFVVELCCTNKKLAERKMVGPATNNYLLVERAQVARRDSERWEGSAGLLSGHGSAFDGRRTPVAVASDSKEASSEDLVVPPPPSTDVELWRRWWTSLPKEDKNTAPDATRNKAATIALRKIRRDQRYPSGRPPDSPWNGGKKLALRFRVYEAMDSISLRSGGDKSRDSDAESDADSDLYGFRPPDGIIPLSNMMRNRFPRTSFFESEDLPFGGAIQEGEANAGVMYSYMPVDVARRNSNRRSIRTPLSKNLFRKSNDSGIDKGEGKNVFLCFLSFSRDKGFFALVSPKFTSQGCTWVMSTSSAL